MEKRGEEALLWIRPDFPMEERKLGESISVNGVCLTVTAWKGESFSVDASKETLARTNLGQLRVQDPVNLERAIRFSDRLGGHLVTGHIDGTGKISQKQHQGDWLFLKVSFAPFLKPFIVGKGSIALDGVSLTVNEVGEGDFSLTIIPHTALQTTLHKGRVGQEVNLETDIIGKYVYQFLRHWKEDPAQETSKVSPDFLREHGFL